MSTLDVTQLAGETMPADAFPAPLKADFRAFFEPDVHRAVHAHASENTRVEICGVLVGEWRKDDNGPFASISNFIRCDNASSEMTEVTFTQQFPDGLPPRGVWGSEGSEDGLTWTMGLVRLALS